jgi:PAS domain S-box-containing protein
LAFVIGGKQRKPTTPHGQLMAPVSQTEATWCVPQTPIDGSGVKAGLHLLSGSADSVGSSSLYPEPAVAKSETFGLLVWPGRLIRASALVIILFDLACAAHEFFWYSGDIRLTLPIYGACLVLGVMLMATSLQPALGENWQVLAFVITSTVVALTTILGIASETADQFFVDLLVLSLAASSLLPWKLVWQAAANTLMLISMGAFAALAPEHDQMLYTHWVGLVAGAAVVQLCSNYGGRYRQEIREQVNSLMQVANRLRQSEATLRRLFQVSCDAISVMHFPDGRYLDINEEFLRQGGYLKEDIVGRSALEVGPPMFRDQRFRAVLQNVGEIRNMDLVTQRPDGGTGSVLLSAVRVEIDNEPCVVTFARDISELKRSQHELIAAREAALAASRAKSEFLSSMSHEIRTPMNAVLGMADVLAETELNSEQRRYLNMIINNGNALLELINGILDVAKVESGRLSLEALAFSPREVAERVLETLAVRAHEKGLELVAQIATNVPRVVIGDPLRLRQILINLVGNAVKFTEQGHVMIKIAGDPADSAMLNFEVLDTGIGMPADRVNALFQPFVQGDSSTSRKYGGSGLGLAIVARLVTLMGGEIKVESIPGDGSAFRFNARFGADVNANREILPDLSNRRMLVVDDSEPNREALKLLMAERGAVIVAASSGAEALELIERAARAGTPFDAVLVDRSMPGWDGYQVARIAAAAGFSLERLIMMLPIENPRAEAAQLTALGIRNYLVKPVKSGELFTALSAVLGIGFALQHAGGSGADAGKVENSARCSQPLRILFADDSPDNRALIRAYMKNAPDVVEFAEDGQEAVSKFKSAPYDLVFMDIQMPIVDGYSAVQELRRWEGRKGRNRTPIIALTASAHEEAVRRAYEVGCDLHISKPLKKRALLEVIGRYQPQPSNAGTLSGTNESSNSGDLPEAAA